MSDKNIIHSTAIVEPGAVLSGGVIVGPFCHIGPHTKIGANTKLHSHVVVMNDTSIGENCELFPGAVLGAPPQDTKYKGEAAALVVGNHNIIREHVTMHVASVGGDGTTRVGNHCMFMTGAHVGHDSVVGNNVIMISHAVLGGHVVVSDGAMIGGNSAVHQGVRVGTGAMIGGMTGLEADLIPFGMAMGDRARLNGLNWVGLERRGLDKKQIMQLRKLYKALFESDGTWADRKESAAAEFGTDDYAKIILEFLSAPSKRNLCMPAQ